MFHYWLLWQINATCDYSELNKHTVEIEEQLFFSGLFN